MEEIRQIPEGWQINSISKLCDIVDYRGKTPKKVDRGTFLVTAKNIRNGKIDYNISKEYVKTEEYEKIMSRGIPKIGDILITTEAPLGEVASIDNDSIALAQRIIKLSGKKEKLENKYLKYYLLSNEFQKEIKNDATGSTVEGIKGSRLRKKMIKFPKSIKEQLAISDILYKLDQNIEKTIKIIEKYKKVKNGLMDDLFTGKIRIKNGEWIEETEFKYVQGIEDIPKDWENGNVASLASINPKKDTKKIGKKDRISFIRMEDTSEQAKILNMDDKKLYEVEKGYTNFHENDVLFAKITPCLENGKGGLAIGLTNGIGFGSTEFHVLRAKRKESVMFVYQYSKYFRLRKKATSLMIGSAGQQRIGKEFFERYKIGIPSISEQKAIGEILNKQDKLIEKEEQYLQKLQKLKNGLMNDLLTGKKRVKID